MNGRTWALPRKIAAVATCGILTSAALATIATFTPASHEFGMDREWKTGTIQRSTPMRYCGPVGSREPVKYNCLAPLTDYGFGK